MSAVPAAVAKKPMPEAMKLNFEALNSAMGNLPKNEVTVVASPATPQESKTENKQQKTEEEAYISPERRRLIDLVDIVFARAAPVSYDMLLACGRITQDFSIIPGVLTITFQTIEIEESKTAQEMAVNKATNAGGLFHAQMIGNLAVGTYAINGELLPLLAIADVEQAKKNLDARWNRVRAMPVFHMELLSECLARFMSQARNAVYDAVKNG